MADHFQLDFAEIGRRDRPGYGFQALVAEIGRLLGYKVEEGGTGADRGRDLFFYVPYCGLAQKSEEQKWLVTCKDFAVSGNSVSRTDVQTCYADAKGFHCYGLLLACTTNAGNDVVELFNGWESPGHSSPIRTHIWNKHNIEQILHEREDRFRLTLARFFPESYGHNSRTSDAVVDVLLDIMSDMSADDALLHAVSVTQAENDPLIQWRVAEAVLRKKPDLVDLHPLLLLWSENTQSGFETAITSSIIEYFCERLEYLSDIGDALADCAPSLGFLSPGFTEFEMTAVKLKPLGQAVVLECSGFAGIEYTDSTDKDTHSSSFPATILLEVTENDYDIREPHIEDTSYADYGPDD